ncbi:MAG: hypothetical protein HY868_24215 [Chloroflexi bacterium]|nr:hypothetical protein [Chloroflexota bacterium]
MRRVSAQWWMGALFVALGIAIIAFALARPAPPVARATPSATPDVLIPTRSPAIAQATRVAPPSRVISTSATWDRASIYWQGKPRWAIGVAVGPLTRYDVSAFSFGWFLDWNAQRAPQKPAGVEYVQMVRVKGGVLAPASAVIVEIARTHPGSLWMIGNEPDVKWQDNVEPARYARLYHDAYTAIKDADVTAQVAIGGVTQPTPLRLRYLDAVLAAYRDQFGAVMPIDVWNVHNFILREERDSWGVEIPPGFSDARGVLYEVDDSGNLDLFRQQIIDFRKWMASRGFQNRALIVSEYGIPMPDDYGFPNARVLNFVAGTFDFFLSATDPAIGFAGDDYKLVQRWCWYSLDDINYPTGRLFDPQTGKQTEFGQMLADYIARRLGK